MVKTGYKQTEIGVLPEDWECVELNRLSDGGMQNGVFYEVNRKGAGVRIINVSDLYKKSPIEFDVLEKFNATDTEIQRFKVKSGDLFFTRSSVVPSGIAYCNWYNENESSIALFDSHVVRFKTDTCSVVPMYLYLQCVSQKSRKYFISVAKTAIMTTIDQSLIGKCLIPLPPKPEQEAIATALSDMDALIDNLEKLIAKKKAIKQGAMQELLTGKRRLPGFTGEWIEHPLCDFIECIRGVSYDGTADINQFETTDTIRLLRSNNISDARFVDNNVQYVNQSKVKPSQLLCVDDIMICMANGSRSLVGKSCYFTKPFVNQYTFGAFMSCVRKIEESVNMEFIFYLMNSTAYWAQIAILFSGSSINNLRPIDILNMKFLFPSDIEQKTICSVFRNMDVEIEQLEKNLAKYRKIKSGMMSELLTGRSRLV